MNRSLGVFIAAAFASLSTGVLAADDGIEGVREQAKATYKMDKKGCEARQDEERRNCLRRAKAQYDQAKTEIRKMKAEQKREKAAERAEKREAKRRARGSDSASGASQRPAAGAQSGAPSSAKPEPGKGMGEAPETAAGSSAGN